jgi:predicted ATPase/DNA-binding SARP family transcriptional activator
MWKWGMSLKIHLLGQFKLSTGNLEIELPSRPAQTLFAYLVLNAGVTNRREKLATLIWPDATETNARSYLRQALWRIRKSLENCSLKWETYLRISDISVTFNDGSDYWLDTELILGNPKSGSVEEMIQLVNLYRGELLPGFYEEWIALERDRLQAAYHQKMSQLLDTLIQNSKWDEALKWGERWIQFGYSPEPAFRAEMRAYAGLGDQTMVSATYQRCQEALDRELGVGPSLETQRLFDQLLHGKIDRSEVPPISPHNLSKKRPPFLDQGESLQRERPHFVAREPELAQLQKYLDLANNSKGRVVLVTGEAGSGKTALIQEFTQRAQDALSSTSLDKTTAPVWPSRDSIIVASGNCNAHTGIGDPYLPFREIMELLTGDVESRWAAGAITGEHARLLWNTLPVTAQALVDSGPDLINTFIPGSALLERSSTYLQTRKDWLPPLEELVERKSKAMITSSPQQSDLFEQYTRVLTALARKATLVLVVDDLQWADLGSVSLLFHLGRQLAGNRILILGAYRPEEIALGRDGERHPLEPVINEFKIEFGDISVNVDQAERRHFVSELIDSEPNQFESSFQDMLYSQTLGHPLFTIELLRGMQERGDLLQDQSGQWIEGPALDWETLPARVEAVVAERISRLDQSLQDALRLASVEGETFTAEVVARIQMIDEQKLLGQLSSELDRKHQLIRAQSIQRLDGQLLSSYRFRHILTQRYLYSGLDEIERVHLHDQVGTMLEALQGIQEDAAGAEVVSIAPQLARHFQEAKRTEKAIHYLHQAGKRAIQLSAYQEALTHLTTGLELLMNLPDSPERAERELALQQSLGMAWVGPKAYGIEVKTAYTRARQLCQQLGKTAQLCQVLGQLSIQSFVQAEYQRALELAEEALSLAQQAKDPILVTLGYWYLGFISFSLGEYTTAQAHLKRVTDFYKPEQHHQYLVILRGSDAGISALAYEACILWCLGYPDQANKKSKQGLALAREFGHPFSLADALCYAGCWFNAMRRDVRALKNYADELMELSTEKGFAGWYETGGCFYGEALALLGQVSEGIVRIRTGMAANESIGVSCSIIGSHRSLAEAQAKGEHPEYGLSTLAEALVLVEEKGERHWEAELHRLRGELMLMQDNDVEAEASFQQAIAIAQRQQAKSWELRATISLARLWQNKGRVDKAREVLGEIYNWFSEGFDTYDLKATRSLLEELAS